MRLRQTGVRMGTWLVVALAMFLSGCVSSDQVLLPLEGDTNPTAAHFIAACDQNCQFGWLLRTSTAGRLVGGLHDGSAESHRVSLHSLDDQNYIAQVVRYDVNGHPTPSYLLLRARSGEFRAYDIELRHLGQQYLQQLSRTGGIADGANTAFAGMGLGYWKVQTKEGLYRVFTDLSKLSDTELRNLGSSVAIRNASAQETFNAIRERTSRVSSENLRADPQTVNVPQLPATGGCPANLPPKLTCTAYNAAPKDPSPQISPEVIYYSKTGCDYCRTIAPYVAAWQLQTKGVNVHYDEFIDWPLAARVYGLDRVPAFVVNRKYLVALSTSEKSTVEAALALVWKLARQD